MRFRGPRPGGRVPLRGLVLRGCTACSGGDPVYCAPKIRACCIRRFDTPFPGIGVSQRRMKPAKRSHVSHRETPPGELQQNPNEYTKTPRNRGYRRDVAGFRCSPGKTQGPTNPFAPQWNPSRGEKREAKTRREQEIRKGRAPLNSTATLFQERNKPKPAAHPTPPQLTRLARSKPDSPATHVDRSSEHHRAPPIDITQPPRQQS